MGKLRKVIMPNHLHFVTTSVVKDLVFPPNPLINGIIKSCIARAQELYPVTICHLLASTTHVHFMLMTNFPENIPGFMERFKTESSHAINRLLGTTGVRWCESYDSPFIYMDIDKAIEKIAYIYANPAKDGLIGSIEEYPGFSTWGVNNDRAIECALIPRSKIREIPTRNLTSYLKALTKKARKGAIRIEPNAWMAAFGIPVTEVDSINNRIEKRVREMEFSAKADRGGNPVVGKKKLEETPICSPFTPSRKGKRTYVISGHVEVRKRLISTIKDLIGRAKEVYLRWKRGDYSVRYPAGLFPPRMPRTVTPLTIEAALSFSL